MSWRARVQMARTRLLLVVRGADVGAYGEQVADHVVAALGGGRVQDGAARQWVRIVDAVRLEPVPKRVEIKHCGGSICDGCLLALRGG